MPLAQHALESAARKVLNGGTLRVAYAQYDVVADGGAAATYPLGPVIPDNAVVTSLKTNELTALAGGTNITFKAGALALTAAIVLASLLG